MACCYRSKVQTTALALEEAHEVPAYAICSNTITAHQAKKTTDKARKLGVPIGVMFDCDIEGESRQG